MRSHSELFLASSHLLSKHNGEEGHYGSVCVARVRHHWSINTSPDEAVITPTSSDCKSSPWQGMVGWVWGETCWRCLDQLKVPAGKGSLKIHCCLRRRGRWGSSRRDECQGGIGKRERKKKCLQTRPRF